MTEPIERLPNCDYPIELQEILTRPNKPLDPLLDAAKAVCKFCRGEFNSAPAKWNGRAWIHTTLKDTKTMSGIVCQAHAIQDLRHTCDCHKHERRVCDICQGLAATELPRYTQQDVIDAHNLAKNTWSARCAELERKLAELDDALLYATDGEENPAVAYQNCIEGGKERRAESARIDAAIERKLAEARK